jgi:pyruvate formate lyase activating enzyme
MSLRLNLVERPNVREARLWRSVSGRDGWVECYLCHRRCLIAPGKYGVCGVRLNVEGKLYTLVYGLLTAVNLDPIEKKPLMHFYPASSVVSIATVGCNFFCKFCQNWEISQSRLERGLAGVQFTDERIVELALAYEAQGITYTYNEPTIFYEFLEDTARLAHRKGLFNTMVTNGYMTPEAVDQLGNLMDAATVDFKGGGDREFYNKIMNVRDPELIYETLIAMRDKGWWVEVTNLVIPRYGDNPENVRRMARWIADNLGPETPFHLLRFHPDYKLTDVPWTPVQTLERLAKIAIDEGLKHVYIGNVPGHPLEHTYCPNCGYKVIERYGFTVTEYRLKEDNRCPRCGYKLNIKGHYIGRSTGYPIPLMW